MLEIKNVELLSVYNARDRIAGHVVPGLNPGLAHV